MKILITGFEPFGGEALNPSWEAVRRVREREGARLIRACLPVEWRRGQDALIELIERENPDFALLTGQAGGRRGVSIERAALNLCEADVPDNAGELMRGAPVVPGAPDAYFATYPYREMLSALRGAGIDARYSLSAGAYLCNCIMYRALHMQSAGRPGMRSGFIHLPFLPEQAGGGPSMPLDEQVRALEMCVDAMMGEG